VVIFFSRPSFAVLTNFINVILVVLYLLNSEPIFESSLRFLKHWMQHCLFVNCAVNFCSRLLPIRIELLALFGAPKRKEVVGVFRSSN